MYGLRIDIVDWLSRSSVGLGRVFDQALVNSSAGGTTTKWLIRFGQFLALLAELAVPRRWWSTTLRRVAASVLIGSALLIAIGSISRLTEVRQVGVFGLGASLFVVVLAPREPSLASKAEPCTRTASGSRSRNWVGRGVS